MRKRTRRPVVTIALGARQHLCDTTWCEVSETNKILGVFAPHTTRPTQNCTPNHPFEATESRGVSARQIAHRTRWEPASLSRVRTDAPQASRMNKEGGTHAFMQKILNSSDRNRGGSVSPSDACTSSSQPGQQVHAAETERP